MPIPWASQWRVVRLPSQRASQPRRSACKPSWMRVRTAQAAISVATRPCTVRTDSPNWLPTAVQAEFEEMSHWAEKMKV